MKVLCGHVCIPVIQKNMHYISWSHSRYARQALQLNYPELSKADIDGFFRQADQHGCYSLPQYRVTLLCSQSMSDQQTYAAFNSAISMQQETIKAEICLFDMRDYQYHIPVYEKGSACFPTEYGIDGSNNGEYIWMIKTHADKQASNYVWISHPSQNNSLCRKYETPLSETPFVFIQADTACDAAPAAEPLPQTLANDPLFAEFSAYYATEFRKDLTDLLTLYAAAGHPMRFYGFGKDHLTNIDGFFLRIVLRESYFAANHDVAKFSLALWTIVISDIVVYTRYHHLSEQWHSVTQYPKFTVWNYNTVDPSSILSMFIKDDPSGSRKAEIDRLIAAIGESVVRSIAADITTLLHLSGSDQQAIADFAASWLTRTGNGEPFDDQCYLY